MKVAINKCYGGFGLSTKAYEWLIKNKKWTVTKFLKDKLNKSKYEDPAAQLVSYSSSGKDKELTYSPIENQNSNEFRTNRDVIEVIETLGDKANGKYSKLEIADMPDDIVWEIDSYDGIESLYQVHRSWS